MGRYQAITTKYLCPTNVRGSRVKATAYGGSLTLHWDHALNTEQNHQAAALALATKMQWIGTWRSGGLPDGSGNCFVCTMPGDSADFVISAHDLKKSA